MEKAKKTGRKISMPETEYRRLRRREKQLLRAKNHVMIAWQVLSQVKE